MVCRILGTPNEKVWPGVTSLQDWNENFPLWPALHIAKFTPGLNEAGIDLLEVCTACRLSYLHDVLMPYIHDITQSLLAIDPRKRISAKEALEHPYLADLARTEI